MEIPVASVWGKEEGDTGRMKKCKVHQDFICRSWLALVSLGKLEVYIEEEGASVCGGWKQCLSVTRVWAGLCQPPIGLFLLVGGMSGVWRVDRMDGANVGL